MIRVRAFCRVLFRMVIDTKSTAIWVVIAGIQLLGCQTDQPIQDFERPNILLIMTDDQGFGDLGLHGNPLIQTPTLDSLGKNSIRLNRFYVSPVCAPTRSSLMTGRYSLRTGVFDTYNGGAIMSDEEITLAEYLQQAGDATGIFGKWHLGDTYPFRPHDQGFDVSWVHAGGGIGQPGDYYENYIKGDSSYFNPILEFNGVKTPTNGYCSDVFTDLAIEFIKERADGPFFAYISYNAPHTPLQVPEEFLKHYENIEISPKQFPRNRGEMDQMNEGDVEAARRVYAMVDNIDHNLSRIWHTIGELGISEQTLIIFITDNGPQQRRFNAGMRNRKGSVYEGGIRVPSFWHWPGRFIPGERSFISAHIDILPTILDICGITPAAEVRLDGFSLLPYIDGEEDPVQDRELVHYWYRGYPEPYHNIAYRLGNYKLVAHGDYQMPDSEFELYDVLSDPFEKNDISSSEKTLVDSLKRGFDTWYADIMESEHLAIQQIRIGTEYQDPVVLGRNDTKGAAAKQWMSDRGMGYWDVHVDQDALYDIKVRFFAPVPVPGRTTVRFGKIQRTIDLSEESGDLVVFKDVPLKHGPCVAEAWHEYRGRIIAPIYVEVSISL